MIYQWEGDCIIRDCAIPNKRYVLGFKEPITTDIREFVSPVDDVIIKDILRRLTDEYDLPGTKNPGDFDKRATIIWDYVAKNVIYEYDRKRLKKNDFWLFPSEVHTIKRGDCEDSSFLLASLLIGSGISPFNVRVALGELHGKDGKSLGGHCWVMYKDESGIWCILESTFDRIPWSMPSADRLTDGEEVSYVPYYCFNNHHLWAIYHDKAGKNLGLNTYIATRKGMPDLRDTKFPSGGWISAITGDNSPGHLELTSDALRTLGFSDDAISIAGDAAQDPDFYEWSNPRAHAQTWNDNNGKTSESPDNAVNEYLGWLKGIIGKILPSAANSPDYGLFFLGYSLHGIQDLAAHQGVTNAQHSYESYINPGKNGEDCDHNEANREVANNYTSRFLKKLRSKNATTFDRMKNYEGEWSFLGQKVSKGKKCELLNKPGWDFSMQSYMEYKGLGKKYEKIKNANPRVTWDRNAVFNKVLNLV